MTIAGRLLMTMTAALALLGSAEAGAQLDQHCVVSILNRTSQPDAHGSWVVANVPANAGRVRARATCVENGVTRIGQSEFFDVPANGVINEIGITFEEQQATPSRINISTARALLPNIGDSEPLLGHGVVPGQPQ